MHLEYQMQDVHHLSKKMYEMADDISRDLQS